MFSITDPTLKSFVPSPSTGPLLFQHQGPGTLAKTENPNMMKHVVDFEGRMYGRVTYIGLNGAMCCVQVGVAFDHNRTRSRSPNLMSTKTFIGGKRPLLCALLTPMEYKIPPS